MNLVHETKRLQERADALTARVLALNSIVRVICARVALASPAWEVTFADARESASYDLRSTPIDGLPPDRAEAVREAAQQIIDATMADLRQAFVQAERMGFPTIAEGA